MPGPIDSRPTRSITQRAGDRFLSAIERRMRDPDRLRNIIAAHIRDIREITAENQFVPEAYRFTSHAELMESTYKRHMLNESTYKGLYFCTYGATGYKVSASVEVDIAELLLSTVTPPFGISLNAGIRFTATPGLVDHLLLIIHKAFPEKLLPFTPSGEIPPNPIVLWETKKPLCFTSLAGKEKSIRFDGEISAGASLGIPSINIDGHSLSLDLAQITAGLNIGCSFFHLEDPQPGQYKNINDFSLELDFGGIVHPGKREVKKIVNEWRIYLLTEYFSAEKLSGHQFKYLRTLLNRRVNLDFSSQQLFKIRSTEEIVRWIEEVNREVTRLQVPLNLSSEDIDDITTRIEETIASLTMAKWNDDQKKQTGEKIPLKFANLMLDEGAKELVGKYSRADVSVWGFGGNASAAAGGGIAQELSLGTFHEAFEEAEYPPSVEAGLGLGAGVRIEAQARFMSSRYQAVAVGNNGTELVFTQDTKVSYTQIIWDYDVNAAATLPFDFELGYGISNERLLKNDMNYYSACAYWKPDPFPGANTVKLEKGSGIGLGISISLQKLKALKENIDTDPPEQFNRRLKKYPYYLGVSFASFKIFLRWLPDSLFEESFMEEYEYILLESNFRFTQLQSIYLNRKEQPRSLTRRFFKDERGHFKLRSPDITALETIRCRVRIGSDLDNTRSVFTLGLRFAGIGGGIGIENIKRAGNMFIKDVFIWDADSMNVLPPSGGLPTYAPEVQPIPPSSPIVSVNRRPNSAITVERESPIPPLIMEKYRDGKVPATVLLPHTFEIN